MGTQQKPCKSCGNMLDKSTKACPQCGKKQKRFPKWVAIGCCILGLAWAISDGISGFNKAEEWLSPAVKTIKESSLSMCPNKTVGQMVEGYFGSPQWSTDRTKGDAGFVDGRILVNVKGKIMYSNQPVDAALQFLFSEDGENFKVQALKINELPQNALMIAGLLENMCKGE